MCGWVVHEDATGQTAIFALNRHVGQEQEITIELGGLGDQQRLVAASELHHADMKAVNTVEAPDTLSPRPNARVAISGHLVTATFKPGSWNVIVTTNGKSS